jgi:DNA-binding transcriptional MerR regulator
MARESGLSVSALRFYDRAGVLVPADVDARSGYRYYAPDQLAAARLVAALRRVGMPLAGIRTVLACRHDPAAVDALLAQHLRLLEQGLADARRELSTVRSLLAEPDPEGAPVSTTVTVHREELIAALHAVRFAVGDDPELPVLAGILFEVGSEGLTLVATDRYRLAVAPVRTTTRTGPAVDALVPAALADRIGELGSDPSTATLDLTVHTATITARSVAGVVEGELLPDAFPDYRRLLAEDGRPVRMDATARAALAAAPTRTMVREPDGVSFEAAVLGLDADGVLTTDGSGAIGVNREFLLQALDAGGPGQLELLLDGPLTPLVVRSSRSTSMLMPVRL